MKIYVAFVQKLPYVKMMCIHHVNASDTVASDKMEIESIAKIEPVCQFLTYRSNRLDETLTLALYGIQDKATVFLENAQLPQSDRQAVPVFVSELSNVDNFKIPIFQCDICAKELSTKNNLIKHKKNVHMETKTR